MSELSLSKDPVITAKELGLECLFPNPNELFIDLDNPYDEQAIQDALQILSREGVGAVISRNTVSAGGNRHVYVVFERALTNLERICLQACFGSDRKRELFSFLRIYLESSNREQPTALFERPGDFREEMRRLVDYREAVEQVEDLKEEYAVIHQAREEKRKRDAQSPNPG